MSVLGDMLKSEREKRGWTKKYVSEKLGLKQVSTYANYEYGIRDPDTDMLYKMAQVYETSTDYLLGKEVKNTKESAYALPESEFERIIKEIEEEQNVDLHSNPIAHQAVKQALEIVVKAMKSSE